MADSIEAPPVLGPPMVKRQPGEHDRQRRKEPSEKDSGDGQAGDDERDIDVAISLMGISSENTTPEMRRALGGVVTELERQRAELEKAQMRAAYLEQAQDQDPVLPVGGRLALLRRLSRAVHRSEQSSMSNALVVLHVSGAHEVRMRAGRPAAERLLAQVAGRIQPALRETDFLAGLGGYEFGLLLPLADEADAEQKARSLAGGVSGRPFDGDDGPVALSVDWGVVTFGGKGDPAALLDAADADLMARRSVPESEAEPEGGPGPGPEPGPTAGSGDDVG